MAKAKASESPGNGGKTRDVVDKRGSHRAAFDQAAALAALTWAKGGQQLDIPGLGVQRFVGVAGLPADDRPREAGRPPGARNLVAQAYREYLVETYGSAIEGLSIEATRPIIAIVAELAEAWITANKIFGRADLEPGAALISEWVTFAKSLQLQARRYVAPYQSTQAPQPVAAPAQVQRIGVAMFTNGQPTKEQAQAAGATLAGLLGIEQNQEVSEPPTLELDAEELDADG